MHIYKTIHVERDLEMTRFYILASLIFFVVFCLSYISSSFFYDQLPSSNYMFVFLACLALVYPIHKFFHLLPFLLTKTPMHFELKRRYAFLPVLHFELQQITSKKMYLTALLLPFIVLNSLFYASAFIWSQFSHYFCLLLAFHCAICLFDLYFIRQLVKAPKSTFIEETSKGYEILVHATYNE